MGGLIIMGTTAARSKADRHYTPLSAMTVKTIETGRLKTGVGATGQTGRIRRTDKSDKQISRPAA